MLPCASFEDVQKGFRVLDHFHADIDLGRKPVAFHFGDELASTTSTLERNDALTEIAGHLKLERRVSLATSALHLRLDEIHVAFSSGGSV